MPQQIPSTLRTFTGFPAQTPPPPEESVPRSERRADLEGEVTEAPNELPAKQRSPASLVVLGLVALAAGIGGGVLLLGRSGTEGRSPAPAPTATQRGEQAPTAAAPADVAPSEAATSTSPAAAPLSASASASALPSAEPPPGASTPRAEGAELAAPPAVQPPSFDLEKIPGDRAALLVRSSATARVFVHGKDYGETNQYLLTSCGIRFIRLGRGLNEFLEPGRSVVVRCGRVTELAIEPTR
jgi:hypothetical protein